MNKKLEVNRKLRALFRPRVLELFGKNRLSFSLGKEISAGLTVGLIALPLSLALGVASIPSDVTTPLPAPALGIITAIVGGLLIALLGGTRIQIGGPTAAFIPIVLLVVSRHGYVGLLVATMMAGMFLILMGISKMGTLIKFIPWPVTSGFTTGIAIAIMLAEIPDFLGLRVHEAVPREFVEKLPWLWHHLDMTNLYAFGLAVGSLLLILLWPKVKMRLIPGSIVAMVVATCFVTVFGWGNAHGVATIGSKFGSQAIPHGLPAPHLPVIGWSMIRDLIGPALAIAILGAIESLLSAVVSDGLSGDRHDSNTELIAQGVGNLVCPLFGGLPVTGAIARTSANIANGGRTPIAGVVHSLALLLVILVAAKWASYIPMAVMASILFGVALRMGEWHELRRLSRVPRSDALVLLTTFTLTVVFDLVVAVEVGMVLAAILFIKRISETTEVSHITNEDTLEKSSQIAQGKDFPDGVIVFRIFGPFMFGATEKMEDAIARIEVSPKVLILRLHLVPAMDATGMNALESVIERMKKRGTTVLLSGIHKQPYEMLAKAGFTETIGMENFCETFDDALARSNALLAA